MVFLQILKSCLWDRFFSFRGRASRAEFWGFLGFSTGLNLVFFAGADAAWRNGAETLAGVLLTAVLTLLFPQLAAAVRRLHDTERSGWWLWLNAIPIVGALVLLVFFLQKGADGLNRFDSDQKIHWGKALKICASALGVLLGLLAGYVLTQIAWLPEKVTPETFLVTEPRLENGDVDYFEALMRHYSDLREHPEKNGFPHIRKRIQDENIVFPALDSDPKSRMAEFAALAAEHDAFLDELSEAVKKPYFLPEWERPAGMIFELSTESDALRNLGQMLSARAQRSVEAGDAERAIDDILTLFLFGRKVGQGPGIVPALVGTAIESMGQYRLRDLLHSEKATDAQLVRLETGLKALPAALTFPEILAREQFFTFDALQVLLHDPFTWEEALETGAKSEKDCWLGIFFDKNLLREYFCREWRTLNAVASEPDPLERQKRYETFEKEFDDSCQSLSPLDLFFLRSRSEYVGRMFLALLIPAERQLDTGIKRRDTIFRLSLLAIQTERFRIQNGRVPASLSELGAVDAFDPFTGRQTLTLRPAPLTPEEWSERYPSERFEDFAWLPWILYSYGSNAQDDQGEWDPDDFGKGDVLF